MPSATYAVSHFLGGEISQFAQGRFDRPDYRFSLKRCLNAFPNEIGTWTRRPGTRYAGHTRGGAAGKVVKFDFQQSGAVTLEFTDGYLRFRSGAVLIDTNDGVSVSAVSSASSAVIELRAAVTWPTGCTLMFDGVTALLQNRQLVATKIDTTHFSIADAVTGAAIDGSTLGAIAAGTARRLHELATAYVGGAWSNVRAVQAETTDILLSNAVAPQALTVTTMPADGTYPQFAVSPAIFSDGPYLDAFTSGVLATPSGTTGIISLALSFNPYVATKAYKFGDFVTDVGVNYRSVADQNLNNTPVSSPLYWVAAEVSAAINDGRGFLGTDIGRLVRLFSEPVNWTAAATFSIGSVVSYNPTGIPGATQYWSSLTAGNTNHVPGADLINWTLITGNAAIWTWGKITSLTNTINRALGASIGDMTSGGGLAAAFDGVFSQAAAASAEATPTGIGSTSYVFRSYVGKNYSAASDQVIQQATVYPSSDRGLYAFSGSGATPLTLDVRLHLRGKASAPSSSSDGTLLGTTIPTNLLAPITIVSSDQTTAWKYVWVEVVTTITVALGVGALYNLTHAIAELSLFSPPGTGTGSGVNLQILGPTLPYTNTITTWRLGAYSDTTGWPSCGRYYEGRLWLGGAIPNRFDACVSNGIQGGTIDFAPTGQAGTLSTGSAITYTLNSDSVNQITDFRADTPGLIACTLRGEFLILAPTTGPIAPTNIAARQVTQIGSKDIPSARTEHTTVFVQRHGRKLIDYFADANFNKPSGQNLADKAQHIVSAGIAELAYASSEAPIIWGRDADGALFGVTYKRDTLTTAAGPTYAAWHRHALGSGRVIESMCIGPSTDGDLDTLTIVTNEAATGIRHVEVVTDTPDETAALADAWFLDDAVTPSSVSSSSAPVTGAPYGGLTINGLWHLNGKTVQVFAGGLDCGNRGNNATTFTDFVVSNGSVFVPYGDGVSSGAGEGLFTEAFAATANIVVGFTYNSDGQMVKPQSQADSGARNGPAFGKISRGHRYAVKLVGTRGLSVGGDFDSLLPVINRDARGDVVTDPLTTVDGIHQDALKDGFDYDNGLAWRVSRPFPANVVAIAVNLSTQDE